MILCLLSLLFFDEALDEGKIPALIDEHSVHRIQSVTGTNEMCVVAYTERAYPIPKMVYYFFSFKDQSGFKVEDGRLRGSIFLKHPDSGFILTELQLFEQPPSFLLDFQGNFVDSYSFDGIKDWPEQIFLTGQLSDQHGNMVISYERPTFEKPDTDQAFLGTVNLGSQTFEEIFVAKKPKNHIAVWAPLGPHFVLLDINSGSVERFEGETFAKLNLFPAMEERESRSIARLKKLGKKVDVPSFLRLFNYTNTIISQNNSISFRRIYFINDQEIEEGVIIRSDGTVEKSRTHQLIWETKDKALFFNFKELEFELRPR